MSAEEPTLKPPRVRFRNVTFCGAVEADDFELSRHCKSAVDKWFRVQTRAPDGCCQKRNLDDSRSESWRVADELHPTKTAWDRAQEVKKDKLVEMLNPRAVPSIKALNACKLSLGVLILSPDKWEGYSVARDDKKATSEQRSLFDDLVGLPGIDAHKVKHAPYIRFTDADGKHELQVREWGAYELLSKSDYADHPDKLWGAAGYRRSKRMMFVVGNMTNHRSNWLIIKTFELEKEDNQPGLYDDLPENE